MSSKTSKKAVMEYLGISATREKAKRQNTYSGKEYYDLHNNIENHKAFDNSTPTLSDKDLLAILRDPMNN